MKEMTGYDIAKELFKIHTHGELCEPEEIVYREKDIINLLKQLGFPEPDWKALGELGLNEGTSNI